MDARFLSELEMKDLEEGRWELMKDLEYQSAILNSLITVPRGFVTDLASVPRVPIVYMAFGDRAHREAVVHDYLYQKHITTKSVADKVFMEAMAARGKKGWIRWGMYLGVMFGGRSSYKSGPSRFTVLNEKKEDA